MDRITVHLDVIIGLLLVGWGAYHLWGFQAAILAFGAGLLLAKAA